jgi:hypothetical protein
LKAEVREPTIVPPPIGVPPRVKEIELIWLVVVENGADTRTRILLDVERGVMVAERPVISTPVVLVVANVSVLVVDTTCRIVPEPRVAPLAAGIHAEPSHRVNALESLR